MPTRGVATGKWMAELGADGCHHQSELVAVLGTLRSVNRNELAETTGARFVTITSYQRSYEALRQSIVSPLRGRWIRAVACV